MKKCIQILFKKFFQSFEMYGFLFIFVFMEMKGIHIRILLKVFVLGLLHTLISFISLANVLICRPYICLIYILLLT